MQHVCFFPVYCVFFQYSCTIRSSNTSLYIYTTKIGTFVCPPHTSETVAVTIMKLAHRPRIASTTKTVISKKNYCPFDQCYLRQFKRIGTPSTPNIAVSHLPVASHSRCASVSGGEGSTTGVRVGDMLGPSWGDVTSPPGHMSTHP